MVRIAVAGGFGDLGRLIVNALAATGNHETFVFSRKAATSKDLAEVGIEARCIQDVLQVDYSKEEEIKSLLESNKIHTVISALNISSDAVSEAQIKLIKAAIATSTVRRFVPSEYNIDYSLPNDKIHYPPKYYHQASRQLLESQSKLEYTYFYFGNFMDYIGMPRIKSHLKPLYMVFDLDNLEVAIPGTGTKVMTVTRTVDGARYVAAALDLPEGTWPRAFAIAGSDKTPLEMAALAEKVMKKRLKVRFDTEESLFNQTAEMLPSSKADTVRGGDDDVQKLICNLTSGIATGAFDIKEADGAVDLVSLMGDTVAKPMGIEDFLRLYWSKDASDTT